MQEQGKNEQVGCPNHEEVHVTGTGNNTAAMQQYVFIPSTLAVFCLFRNDRQKYTNANKTVSRKAAGQKK